MLRKLKIKNNIIAIFDIFITDFISVHASNIQQNQFFLATKCFITT